MKIWIAHDEGVPLMAPLPEGADVEVYTGEGEPPSDPADVEFWVPTYMAAGDSTALMDRMTSLKVVQLLSAGADVWEPRMPASVTLCDAKGVHTVATAEWAVTAMLASLRRFPYFARAQAKHRWDPRGGETLCGKKVLVLGAGDIGETIARRVEAFDATVTRVARTPREGVRSTADLPALLPDTDIVVVVVPLTPETEGMVDERFLGLLPAGALLVNAARGKVVDAAALLAETSSGRLRAALDVTDPEPLPAESPLWDLDNVLITPHVGGDVPGIAERGYRLVGKQLRRYAAGEPLVNVVANGY